MAPISGRVSSCLAFALSIVLSSLPIFHLHFFVCLSSSQALILIPCLTRLLMLFCFSCCSVLFLTTFSFPLVDFWFSFLLYFFASYPQPFFCSTVSEALFAISSTFLSELFFRLVHAKAALYLVKMNNTVLQVVLTAQN